jgi:hypothetical protein
MNVLSPSTLRQMGDANELRPVSLREDPAYFEPEDADEDSGAHAVEHLGKRELADHIDGLNKTITETKAALHLARIQLENRNAMVRSLAAERDRLQDQLKQRETGK